MHKKIRCPLCDADSTDIVNHLKCHIEATLVDFESGGRHDDVGYHSAVLLIQQNMLALAKELV